MKHKITLHAKVLHKADGTGQKRAFFDRLHNIARTDLAIYFSHVVAYMCHAYFVYTSVEKDIMLGPVPDTKNSYIS